MKLLVSTVYLRRNSKLLIFWTRSFHVEQVLLTKCYKFYQTIVLVERMVKTRFALYKCLQILRHKLYFFNFQKTLLLKYTMYENSVFDHIHVDLQIYDVTVFSQRQCWHTSCISKIKILKKNVYSIYIKDNKCLFKKVIKSVMTKQIHFKVFLS